MINYQDFLNKEYNDAGELDADILLLEENVPEKKNKKEYLEYLNILGNLRQKYNTLVKFKCYAKSSNKI